MIKGNYHKDFNILGNLIEIYFLGVRLIYKPNCFVMDFIKDAQMVERMLKSINLLTCNMRSEIWSK